jgi:hypothetical protein
MGHLGLLALGVFIGTLLCIAVRKTTSWSDAVKVIVAIVGAALSGTVFTFIEKMMGTSLGPALYMYPVGLAWSLLWLYADQAIDNVKATNSNQKIVGWLHISGMVLGTVLILLLLLSKQFRDLLPPQ